MVNPLKAIFDGLTSTEQAEVSDSLYKIISDEIQYEIDQEVLEKLNIIKYNDLGWHRVTCEKWIDTEVLAWLQETIAGKYDTFRNHYFFESEEDATLFALAWR